MNVRPDTHYVSVAAVRWSLSIIFIVCLLATLVVSIQSRENDQNLERALVIQTNAVAQIKVNSHNLCLANQNMEINHNAIVDNIITATEGSMNNPAFIAKTVAQYKKIKVSIIKCVP